MRENSEDSGGFKVVVEEQPDGYVAYAMGLDGIVVGQGDSYAEALADVRSAIRFHVETFGIEQSPERSAGQP